MCCEHNVCMLLTVCSFASSILSQLSLGCGKLFADAHAQNVKQEEDTGSSVHFCECTNLSNYIGESCNFIVVPAKCLVFAPAAKVRRRS